MEMERFFLPAETEGILPLTGIKGILLLMETEGSVLSLGRDGAASSSTKAPRYCCPSSENGHGSLSDPILDPLYRIYFDLILHVLFHTVAMYDHN